MRETQLTVSSTVIRTLSLLEPVQLAAADDRFSSQDTRGEDDNERNDAPHSE
jgi:hypothetical protein